MRAVAESNLLVGTSGFGYKQWRGHFYPTELSEKQFLPFYSSRLRSVEINNSFYRMPRKELLGTWASQVPDGFRFAIKASRRITHIGRMGDVADATELLLDNLQALGSSLGVVLFQLPPNLRSDLPRLGKFLELLGGRVPAAFEFRHDSWFRDDVLALLERHAAALCIGDPDDRAPTPPTVRTAPFCYVRLRKNQYTAEDLALWAQRLQGLEARQVFVFFKHEQEAPRYALELQELWGAGSRS